MFCAELCRGWLRKKRWLTGEEIIVVYSVTHAIFQGTVGDLGVRAGTCDRKGVMCRDKKLPYSS